MPSVIRKGLVALGVVVVIVVLAVGVLWWRARPATPDAFYTAPSSVPAEPGQLVRSEPFTRGVPAGARAWRILYTTTLGDGSPAVASGLVVTAQPEGVPGDIVVWSHGTTGVAQGCAPSLLDKPFGGIPALQPALDQGWVLVATDYVGLGTAGAHAYLVGEDEGRAVLDSMRALEGFDEVATTGEAVVWGHSQGGHAALFAGELAGSYAPELDVVGIAAVSPATDLGTLFAAAEGSPVGTVLTSMTVTSWQRVYPDLRDRQLFRTGTRVLAHDIASRCLTGPEALLSGVEAMVLPHQILEIDPNTDPEFSALLALNTPSSKIDLPLFVGQGSNDELVIPRATDGYVTQRCGDGELVDYHRLDGQDHLSIVQPDSPITDPLMAWTEARFAAAPAPTTCPT